MRTLQLNANVRETKKKQNNFFLLNFSIDDIAECPRYKWWYIFIFCSLSFFVFGVFFFGGVFNVIFTGIKYFGDIFMNCQYPSIPTWILFICLLIGRLHFPCTQTTQCQLFASHRFYYRHKNSTQRTENIQFVYMASSWTQVPSSKSSALFSIILCFIA